MQSLVPAFGHLWVLAPLRVFPVWSWFSLLCSLSSFRRRVWWWLVQSDLPICSRHRTVYVLVGQVSYWPVVWEFWVWQGRGWFSRGHWFCMCSQWAQRSLGCGWHLIRYLPILVHYQRCPLPISGTLQFLLPHKISPLMRFFKAWKGNG